MNTTDRGRVIDLLCQQIDHPVDFVSQVEMAYEAGIRRFVEIGPKAVLTHLVDEMLQGKPFQVINLDDPKENILHRLNSLKETLSHPLVIHRRPLPTKPRYVRVNSPEVDSFTRPISAADSSHHGATDESHSQDQALDLIIVILFYIMFELSKPAFNFQG